jgi:HAE1 family hydrophobic/amphiphilic exporter-1
LFTAGKTINIISLSSLAIACGMVVDNAIVVVDNIYRHMERGQRPREAAIFGTQEMLLSIGASTLTTIVVFLPMFFVAGVVGIMFEELATIVTVTLLASLFTATTFTPMLCAKWLRFVPVSAKPGEGKFRITPNSFYNISEKWFKAWEDWYAKSLSWGLKRKKIVIFGFLSVFIISLFLTRFIGNEFIPEEDSGDIRITVELAVGTRVEETDKAAEKIEDIFKNFAPETSIIYVRSGESTRGLGRVMGGESGTHVVTAGTKLVPKKERKRSVAEVSQALRREIKKIPGVFKINVSTGNPIGRMIAGGGGKAVQIEIIGHSFEDTNAFAEKLKAVMEKIPGVVDTSISRDISLPELKIEVDREKAASLGLAMNTIASSIKTFIEGSTATKYREKGKTYDIHVRLHESSRAKIEDIESLSIISPLTGKQIKLVSFAKIYEIKGPIQIERINRERVIEVECNIYKRSAGKVIEDIKKQVKLLTIPSDVSVNFAGEAEEQGKAFKDLLLLLILGILLVYMVMAAQFESLVDPLIVMFSIPFTFTGVLFGFLITGTTLSVIAFLGVVMLMGIVVNNAIVLISYISILRRRGHSVIEAVTLGGMHRLRPILMTTITTVAGLLPMALSRGAGSETWQPLGITIISGLTLSTLVTMIFIPTLYAVVEGRTKKRGQ